VGASPANAVSVSDVSTYAGYAKTAYSAYQFLFGNELTLDQAVQQIKDAIAASQTQIVAEIDRVAADSVRSCARTAVINYADINQMSADTLQSYANDTTRCVTDGWSLIDNTVSPAAVDELGFALNLVGPLALTARARAFGVNSQGNSLLRDTIVQADQSNLTRLKPTCSATRGETVGNLQEISLTCRAYNGDTGSGTARVGVGTPLPQFDYSTEIAQAMQRTSYPVSISSLDGLLEDPVVASPGNQTTIVGNTVSLQLHASHGAPAYTWSITGLPPGLVANSSGLISGAPSQGVNFTVRAAATDTQAQTGSVNLTWTVVGRLFLNPASLGDRSTPVGTEVNAFAVASGGTTPYIWSVTGLPNGLHADTTTGQITGKVAASPVFNTVTVTVHDASGQVASKTLTWTVPAPTINPPVGLKSDSGKPYSGTLTATGGTAPYTWSAVGLPAGLSVDSSGHISGSSTPTGATSFPVTFTVTDAAGHTGSLTVTWKNFTVVPNVQGMTGADASHTITNAGLVSHELHNPTICVDPGFVITQNPGFTAEVAGGTSVSYTVDTSPRNCTVK
jgi:hypothetical protein